LITEGFYTIDVFAIAFLSLTACTASPHVIKLHRLDGNEDEGFAPQTLTVELNSVQKFDY